MQHRSRAALTVLTAVVAFGGVLAACGGGEPERISRAAMVRAADEICAQGLREAERLREGAVIGARGEAAATEIDATLEALNRQVDGFTDLRGPEATDPARERAIRQLGLAAEGLETLRRAAVADDLTVDEAIRALPEVVARVNAASADASDALVDLGFLTCVGLASE